MEGTHVFFHALIVVMGGRPPSSSAPPPLHLSKHLSVHMWVSPTCNQWLQDLTICSRVCATLLLRSPSLQFRAPLDVTERGFPVVFLFPRARSWATPCGPLSVRLAGLRPRLQDCRELGRAAEGFATHLNPLAGLRMAPLCLSQTNEENT